MFLTVDEFFLERYTHEMKTKISLCSITKESLQIYFEYFRYSITNKNIQSKRHIPISNANFHKI